MVIACRPGQLVGDGGEEEPQRPRNNDIVEEINVKGDEDYCIAYSLWMEEDLKTPLPRNKLD